MQWPRKHELLAWAARFARPVGAGPDTPGVLRRRFRDIAIRHKSDTLSGSDRLAHDTPAEASAISHRTRRPRPSAGHSVVVHAGGTPACAEHRRDAHRTVSSCNRSRSSTRRRSSRSRSSRNWSTRHRDAFRCRGSRARRSRRTRCSRRRSRAAGSARTAAWAALSVAARRARTDHRPDSRERAAGSRGHPVAQRPAASPDSPAGATPGVEPTGGRPGMPSSAEPARAPDACPGA